MAAPSNTPSVKVLITAAEAYPALERLFLQAQTEIELGFRIFDPDTLLLGPEARAVGKTWFDLIIHTLRRGVRLRFALADFDPVAAAREHRRAWYCMRRLAAAREIAGKEARLTVIVAMHPAKAGLLPRLALWPKANQMLRSHCEEINAMEQASRDRALSEMPALKPCLICNSQGRWSPLQGRVPLLRPATHHQKLAVVDQTHLYIGGLDLNNRRMDTPEHRQRAEGTWHDVQLIVSGSPAVKAAHRHLTGFLDEVAGRAPTAPAASPFLRTLSVARRFRLPYLSPLPKVREIADAHRQLADRAERLIYLETQFFRDLPLARHLARLARRKPDLSMILILPAAPEDVAFGNSGRMDARFGEYLQARALRIVSRAFGKRLLIASPVQPVPRQSSDRDTLAGSPLIYVHAKVSIFDDAAAIVSSANLNGRSLAWDTEAGILLDHPENVAHLRQRCFAHWLPKGAEPALHELNTAQQAWRALAFHNARLPPKSRRGFLVPYAIKPGEKLGQDLVVIPSEMV